MVKRNPPRNRRVPGIELFMECTEEPLSQSQITAQQVARYQYDQAIAKIRDAQAKARVGKATIINKVDSVGKVTPQVPQKTTPQKSPIQKESERSSSPDIIFVGETPPSKPRQPVQQQQQPQPRSLVVTSRSPNVAPINGHQPQTSVSQQVYKLVSVSQANQTQWLMKPIANVAPQQQTVQRPGQGQYGQPVGGTYGMGYKRPLQVPNHQDQVAKKKPKKTNNENEIVGPKRPYEADESGNWVPLDEYYYGKMEGEPTYEEEKGEFRFKCWYCNKMLYNNVKAMMHIQGHIDSSKQQNIDLSDLTQCKHCYKQFDTPFEMQTHVDKVHMSNTNVLLCRICDRDHESRNALTSHMRLHHNACEMPYTCQLCKFRSSMYSDVVDHFKKKHDSSQHLLCLYCLRVFVVKFVSQGWGTTQTYYGHLLKHQSKAQNKKCGLCRLQFFNAQEVKAHKQKHHGPNQKAVLGTAAHSSKPDQVLIKIPSQNKHCVKSLNAPAVSKVLDFGGTTFPGEVHYYNCFECKMSMGTHDHYRKYVECSMCRFATICSIAYANHMMGFHSGQMSSLNLNIPWERKMSKPMYCLCGFSSSYGNKIANHLVFCMKSSCYENRPEGGYEVQKEEEESDPRHKPGASLLDALGLVKRRTVTPRTSEEVYGKSEDHSPPKEVKKPSPWDPEPIPPELQGSRKWSTVKLKDLNTPTKESVFIGDGSKDREPVPMETGDRKETEKGDNSHKQSDEIKQYKNEVMDEDKLLETDNGNTSADKTLEEAEDEKVEKILEDELLKEKDDEKLLVKNEHEETVKENDDRIKQSESNSEPSELKESSVSKDCSIKELGESHEIDELSQKDRKNVKEEDSASLPDQETLQKGSLSDQETLQKGQESLQEGSLPDNKSVDELSQKDNDTTDSSSQNKAAENTETESQNKVGKTESEDNLSEPVVESDIHDVDNVSEPIVESDTQDNDKVSEPTVESDAKDQDSVSEPLMESDKQDKDKMSEPVVESDTDDKDKVSEPIVESDAHNMDVESDKQDQDKVSEPVVESDTDDKDKMSEPVVESDAHNMDVESDKQVKDESDVEITEKNESENKEIEPDSQEKDSTDSEKQSVEKEDNSETGKPEQKNSAHGEHHGSRLHDQKPHDDHRNRSDDDQRSRSHEDHRSRSDDDHRSRSHDDHKSRSSDERRSHNDRRPHDRNHYEDRRQYERYDDRNRYRRQDDRNYDRGYRDNRGYRDHRDNWDYHRDDRRHNRGQGSYQGHGGYGGGYHGYR